MRIVISLTTLPSRLLGAKILKTLKSLRNQTIKPNNIYLGLPEKAKRIGSSYPEPSSKILSLCTVVKLDEDYGPVSKLAGGILSEDDPDTIIISVDDDVIYPPTFVEELLEKSKLKPDTAIGSSGVVIGSFPSYISFIRNESYKRYEGWFGKKLTKKGQEVDILCGYAGVLYKRRFFPKRNSDVIYKFLKPSSKNKSLFMHDDIYISGYLSKRGIPRHVYIISDVKLFLESVDSISGGMQFHVKFVKSLLYCHNHGMFQDKVYLPFTHSISGQVSKYIFIVIIICVLFFAMYNFFYS